MAAVCANRGGLGGSDGLVRTRIARPRTGGASMKASVSHHDWELPTVGDRTVRLITRPKVLHKAPRPSKQTVFSHVTCLILTGTCKQRPDMSSKQKNINNN